MQVTVLVADDSQIQKKLYCISFELCIEEYYVNHISVPTLRIVFPKNTIGKDNRPLHYRWVPLLKTIHW